MSTTSLKISDALKQDIQNFAALDSVSSHAFMVSALESEVRRRRLRAEFLADAEAAAAEIDAGGPVYAAEDVRQWVKARIRSRATGEVVPDPQPVRGNEKSVLARKKKKSG
jgi:predicted transcriptional regulator